MERVNGVTSKQANWITKLVFRTLKKQMGRVPKGQNPCGLPHRNTARDHVDGCCLRIGQNRSCSNQGIGAVEGRGAGRMSILN